MNKKYNNPTKNALNRENIIFFNIIIHNVIWTKTELSGVDRYYGRCNIFL